MSLSASEFYEARLALPPSVRTLTRKSHETTGVSGKAEAHSGNEHTDVHTD